MFMNALQKYINNDFGHSHHNWPQNQQYDTIPASVDKTVHYNATISGNFVQSISKVVQVYNPYLYSHFLIKKAEYETRGHVVTRELYHDTGEDKVDSILTTNLDWRRVVRAKFGKGVSFSPDPAYANRQSSHSNGTNRAMIVADVLIGKKIDGNPCQKLPPDGFDTTCGNNNSVYVKYYDNEFYPKYVVYYQNRR